MCWDLRTQILVARRLERLEAIKTDLEARFSVKVIVGELDLTDAASADAFFAKLPEEVRDNVDVLVNNAGAGVPLAPVYESNWEDLNSIIDTNVKGVIKMIKLFVPGMLKRNTGHIINISSVLGKDSSSNIGLYAGTKFFVEAINTSLRAELVATPLRVSLVSPGLTESEFSLAMHKGDASKAGSSFKGLKALESADIADTIVYVASRPAHVQVVDATVVCTSQASIHLVHRDTPKSS